MKTRKVFAVILVAIAVMLSLCSCTPTKSPEKPKTGYEERALEKGFYVETRPSENERGAFTTETNKFDIDNVEVTFYYGARSIRPELNYIDGFDIYFTDGKREKKILYKHVDDQFYSEKYRVSTEKVDDYSIYKFNHIEKIKIPAEVFSENGEYITFTLYGERFIQKGCDPETGEDIYKSEFLYFSSIRFYYRKYGRTVYLFEEYVQSL